MTAVQLAQPSVDLSHAEEVLVSTFERHQNAEIRISVVRLPKRRDAMVCVSIWTRVRFFNGGHAWRPTTRHWNGAVLLQASELPRVMTAMQRAVERARDLGWEVQ